MASDGIFHVRGSAPNSNHRPRTHAPQCGSASWCIPERKSKVEELGRRHRNIPTFVAITLRTRSSRSQRFKPDFGFGHCRVFDRVAFLADGSDTTAIRSAYVKERARLQTCGGSTNYSDVKFAPRYIGRGRNELPRVCALGSTQDGLEFLQ